MTKFIQILLIIISAHFPQFRRDSFRLPDEIVRELTRKKIRKRRPPPLKKFERRRKEFFHPKYRSTKPRDHRFSNQQKLRRMFRND